jgi:hypothetical protein
LPSDNIVYIISFIAHTRVLLFTLLRAVGPAAELLSAC